MPTTKYYLFLFKFTFLIWSFKSIGIVRQLLTTFRIWSFFLLYFFTYISLYVCYLPFNFPLIFASPFYLYVPPQFLVSKFAHVWIAGNFSTWDKWQYHQRPTTRSQGPMTLSLWPMSSNYASTSVSYAKHEKRVTQGHPPLVFVGFFISPCTTRFPPRRTQAITFKILRNYIITTLSGPLPILNL